MRSLNLKRLKNNFLPILAGALISSMALAEFKALDPELQNFYYLDEVKFFPQEIQKANWLRSFTPVTCLKLKPLI